MEATANSGHRVTTKHKFNSTTLGLLVIAILVKGKVLLGALVKFKYIWTIMTACLSVFAYAGRLGWAAAVGFVGLIFVHEMGHVIVLKRQGVPTTVPLFIPFMGAFIGLKESPKDAVSEAYAALGGPVVGSVGAYVCLAIYFMTGDQLWAWLAYVGIFLNLFNLLPMSPLDGGRVIGAVWRGFWVLGILAAVGVAVFLDSLLLMLFAVWGLDDINEKFMPVHPVFYYALGMTTLIASCCTGESLGGAMIAIFAIIHGLIAHKKNRLKREQAAEEADYLSATFATQREVEEFAGRMPQVEGSTPLRDRLVGLKKPLTPVRSLRKRDFTTVSGIVGTAGDGGMVQRMLSNQAYFSVPKSQRMIIGSVYVGLAFALSGTLYWMHQAGLFHRPPH